MLPNGSSANMIEGRTKNHMVIRTAPEDSGKQKQQRSLSKLDHFIVGHGLKYKQFYFTALTYSFFGKRKSPIQNPISMKLILRWGELPADCRKIVTTLMTVGPALLDLTSTFRKIQEVFRFAHHMIRKRRHTCRV